MTLKCVYCEEKAEFISVVSVCKEHLELTENDIPSPGVYEEYWDAKGERGE